jgi:hypothetical protein
MAVEEVDIVADAGVVMDTAVDNLEVFVQVDERLEAFDPEGADRVWFPVVALGDRGVDPEGVDPVGFRAAGPEFPAFDRDVWLEVVREFPASDPDECWVIVRDLDECLLQDAAILECLKSLPVHHDRELYYPMA